MKTETEARKCWCPFDHGTRKPILASEGALCIASECMAWRFIESELKPLRVHPAVLEKHWLGWTVTDPKPDANGHVEISPPQVEKHGYCGLAGHPRPAYIVQP